MSGPLPSIAHFDLDSFFVSVEIRNNPALKGKPVAVGGYERGVVAACSYEARKFGIHSAMPMKLALQRCPDLIVTPSSGEAYSRYSRWVTDIIASQVPLFEKASIDEFYVDLTGMDKFFGTARFARGLRERIIEETGLPISCGLSSARFISMMATNAAKPNGFLEIPHGKETAFLWPLGIETINGVGKQTEQLLKGYGFHTIGDLARTTPELLERIAGKWGEALWNKAWGRGSTTISTDWEQKSISHENTFESDQTDPSFLNRELVRLTEKTAHELRSDGKMAGCVTVKIRYADFETTTRQERIDYTALDDVLCKRVKELFRQSWKSGRPVRLLGVRFSQLIATNLQMDLFERAAEKLNLYRAVDDIKERFGRSSVTKATVLRTGNDPAP